MSTHYLVGTSGFHYSHWRDKFYPHGLPSSQWLAFYAQRFPTVELNNPFYRLPTAQAFESWRDTAPKGFLFAVKASRFITHIKRLRECEQPLQTMLDRARHLEEKLGPILYQLPPGFHRDDERLEAFLRLLPEGYQHVFEFRHKSWFDQAIYNMLARHGAIFCAYDMTGIDCPLMATAAYAYLRFHGSHYGGCYSDEDLADWARRIRALADERELEAVYVYFNNDAEGFAIQNAATMGSFLAER
ncbi:MAG: DUF72 domain-containing protein [Chloroflexi bacterium]|nr:DUF72 domain-containing protein [Chloroflexota bacterium]